MSCEENQIKNLLILKSTGQWDGISERLITYFYYRSKATLCQKRNEVQIIFIQYFPLFQSDVAKIEETLKNWCESCDGMLACLEEQVNRANETKQSNIAHQKQIEQKVR